MATLERTVGSKLGWMIAGRLVTALLLSVVGTLWTGQASQSINKSLGLLTIVACLTIFYALIFRLSKNILLQARFQLAVDVLLVTWLVWNSAVIQSPYVALYIVIIAVSSLFLGPREAVVTSVGCAVAFTACALEITGLMSETDPSRLVGGSVSQTIQWVGLFDVAFFVSACSRRDLQKDSHALTCASLRQHSRWLTCAPCTNASWRPFAPASSRPIWKDASSLSTSPHRRSRITRKRRFAGKTHQSCSAI